MCKRGFTASYQPATKLREGNDFNRVCLSWHSVCRSERGGGLTISFCVGNSPGFIPPPRHVETCWNWTSLYKDPSSGYVQTFHYEALNGRWPPNRAFTVICSNLLCFLRYIGSVQQSLHLLHHRALHVRVSANCNKMYSVKTRKRNWT